MQTRHQDNFRIAEQAAQWLDTVEQGGTAERAAFAAWLKESPHHLGEVLMVSAMRKEFAGLDLSHLLQDSEGLANTRNILPLRHEAASVSCNKGRRRWFAAAAAVAVAISIPAFWLLPDGPGRESYSTQVGEQREVELADGSLVQLNTRSRVQVRFSQQAREIELLQGEALFDVVPDPSRPFRVHAGSAVIQAVGTQFTVYRRARGTTVAVIDGSVQIQGRQILKSGEQAGIAPDGAIEQIAQVDCARAVAWRERRLVFVDDRLVDIVAEFNRYNRVPQIQVRGEALGERRLTGVFDAHAPESFVRFLNRNSDLSVQTDDDTVSIQARSAAADAPPDTNAARTSWLEANAAPLRSIDPNDEDFSDLEPMRAAIGDARVVLLGEQSHGDGTTFLAKTRLIRFLHQRMGFDVLAFESGLFDCSRAWDHLVAGESPDKAFQRGVFGIWTGSAQFKPAMDYVGSTVNTARPLEMTGFDSQFTASASSDFLLANLEAFLVSQGILPQLEGWPDVRTILEAVIGNRFAVARSTVEQRRTLLAVLDDIHARVKALPADDAVRYGAAFWTQMLESMSVHVRSMFEAATQSANKPALNNSRDLQMARNFLWLANHRHAGRKIIVWAATSHNMRHPEAVVNPDDPDLFRGLNTMGQTIWEAMGAQTYNVGFIASEGSAGAWRTAPHALSPHPAGSIDALWAGTSHRFAFLDLKHPGPGGEWLRTPLLAGPLGYMPLRADWTKVLDGLVYTRVMEPSTPAATPEASADPP